MIRHHSLVCRCGIADFIVFSEFSKIAWARNKVQNGGRDILMDDTAEDFTD